MTALFHPIGIFDSGVGGLGIWREIIRQFPNEDTIYIADQAHVPYGSRSLSEVRYLSTAVTRFLLQKRAKTIVIACNTASAAALRKLRATFPQVPFVGMEPALKPACECTRTGVVGVIATPATFQGELFSDLLRRYAPGVQVIPQVCPGLVEAVEAGAWDGSETEALLHNCLDPLMAKNVDQLVLGCTHYTFLRPVIERVVGSLVSVVDPAPAVARQTGRVTSLVAEKRLASHTFYTTGQGEALKITLERLMPSLARERGLAVFEACWQGGQLAATLVGSQAA